VYDHRPLPPLIGKAKQETSNPLRRGLQRAVFNFLILLFTVPRHGRKHGMCHLWVLFNFCF
jgi:hypothetical protein